MLFNIKMVYNIIKELGRGESLDDVNYRKVKINVKVDNRVSVNVALN